MVGHDEALEAGHVSVGALPGDQEVIRVDGVEGQAVDAGQGTQLRVLDREEEAFLEGLRLGALGPHLGAASLHVQPLPVGAEPDLLGVGLAGTDQRIA